MNKFEYFTRCMAAECYRSKAWVISAFSVVISQPAVNKQFLSDVERRVFQYQLRRNEAGLPYFIDPDTNSEVVIDDGNADEPVFQFRDTITLPAGTCINLDQDIETTYGAWLFNNILLVYPFGNKIPYAANGYTIKDLETLIEKRLADDPADGTTTTESDPRKQPIYVSEYIRFNEAAGSLTGFTQLCVPAATPMTLTIDPAILKRRDELFAQYKDQLHDPAIQARISEELTQMDRASFEKDPDRGFYYRDKSFSVTRKKLFLFNGSEMGFTGAGKFITSSLNEGINPEDIPDLASGQRYSSFSRGANTALGGVAVKYNLRMFQNVLITPGDCGARLCKPQRLTKSNFDDFVGRYHQVNGKTLPITAADTALIGSEIELRTPLFCHAEHGNFCSICAGDQLASTPDAISTYAASIGSVMMLVSMKKMHGTALKLTKYDYKFRLT